MQLDRIDRRLLTILSSDGRASVSRVAELVGLSQSACTRRLQALESGGVIAGYGTRLCKKTLGFGMTALVDITLRTQVAEDLVAFERSVSRIDGVVECSLISGKQDYRLKVVCRDLDDYERLHREHLGQLPGVSTISSFFVLRSVQTRDESDALLGHI